MNVTQVSLRALRDVIWYTIDRVRSVLSSDSVLSISPSQTFECNGWFWRRGGIRAVCYAPERRCSSRTFRYGYLVTT